MDWNQLTEKVANILADGFDEYPTRYIFDALVNNVVLWYVIKRISGLFLAGVILNTGYSFILAADVMIKLYGKSVTFRLEIILALICAPLAGSIILFAGCSVPLVPVRIIFAIYACWQILDDLMSTWNGSRRK